MGRCGEHSGRAAVAIAIALTLFSLPTTSEAAGTIPACRGKVSSGTYQEDVGSFVESVLVGGQGRVYVSLKPNEPEQERVLLVRFDRPRSVPSILAEAPDGNPGGLAWRGRKILWGNIQGGQGADEDPRSLLYLVDPVGGTSRPFATGLGQANGVARAENGFIYSSNNLGLKLDRISPAGGVDHSWGRVESANGLVVSADQRFLFASQTFDLPGSVARIDLRNPSKVITWWGSGDRDANLLLDGLTRDSEGNLYVTSWLLGGIIKIDTRRRACLLVTGIRAPTSLGFGYGSKGRRSGALFVTSFFGPVVTVTGAQRASYPR